MLNQKVMVLVSVALGFLVLATSNAKPTDLAKSFEVKSGGTLYLDSRSGSVAVDTHDQDLVEIEVVKKGDDVEDFEVTFEQRGNDVIVEGDRKGGGWGVFRNGGVRFVIKVPETYNLNLKTGGGSISVSDLTGTVNVRTSGGSIELGRMQGDVDVDTSGGSIKVEEVYGNISAHTSGGSIRAKITQQPTQDVTLSTSGGSVTATLFSSIAVDLDASTSGGRVRTDFEVDGNTTKRRIRGKINGGGPELKLKTSGGSVNIQKI